jgi:hypothetical protein
MNYEVKQEGYKVPKEVRDQQRSHPAAQLLDIYLFAKIYVPEKQETGNDKKEGNGDGRQYTGEKLAAYLIDRKRIPIKASIGSSVHGQKVNVNEYYSDYEGETEQVDDL